MSVRDRYPAGVPCWVETLQANPRAALDFYVPLFGWEIVGPASTPGDPPGEYFVARVKGRDVAGIGSLPRADVPPAWNTYIRVDSADETVEKAKSAGGRLLDGPFDAPPAGRMAVLADTAGAVFCVWEAGTREGAQLVNEPAAWAMSLLHTTDAERAKTFYGAIFGWQTQPFDAGGTEITLWRRPGYVGGEPQQPVPRDVVAVMLPAGDGPSYWSVDFWVDDADAAAEYAIKLGGKVIAAPRVTPAFRTAVLADPQGAMFSISQLIAGRARV